MDEDNKIYYVYAYLDTRKKGEYVFYDIKMDYEPFYIGKGKKYTNRTLGESGERMNEHIYESKYNFSKGNQLKLNKIRKIKEETGNDPSVVKLKDDMLEQESLILETNIIKHFGRIDNNTGILTNMTDGGEGESGRVVTEQWRNKLSESGKLYFKNNPVSDKKKKEYSKFSKTYWSNVDEDTKKEIFKKRGKSLSDFYKNNPEFYTEERKKKMSDNMKGKVDGEKNPFYGKHHTKETVEKIKQKTSGSNSKMAKRYVAKNPNGELIYFKGMKKFCEDNNINSCDFRHTLKTGKELRKGKSIGWQLIEEIKE